MVVLAVGAAPASTAGERMHEEVVRGGGGMRRMREQFGEEERGTGFKGGRMGLKAWKEEKEARTRKRSPKKKRRV